MRDWEATVRERLGGLSLETEDRREVIAELVSHLEETFEQLRQQGLQEDAAAERALSQVKNWQSLRRKIQMERSTENTMTKRVRQFWLPGFLTLLLSMVLLMVIQFIGPKPLIVGTHGWRMMTPMGVIYVPWLLSLLPIGAMGAYLAGRASASQRTMFLSIIFPVLPYLALFAIAFPVSLVLDDHVAHNIMYEALLMGLLAWVVLPGIALLAGGLPIQIFLSRQLSSRGTFGS